MMLRKTATGAGIGLLVSLPTLGFDYTITKSSYMDSKLEELTSAAGCAYETGFLLSSSIYIKNLVSCSMQNVSDWIISTAETYSKESTIATLPIAVPTIVLGCVAIGGMIGAVNAYRAKQAIIGSLNEELLLSYEQDQAMEAQSMSVNANRFNNGSSSPTRTPSAMFSAAKAENNMNSVSSAPESTAYSLESEFLPVSSLIGNRG